jgi:hypothetical protein
VGAVLRAYAKSLPLASATAAVSWPLAAWLRASSDVPTPVTLLLAVTAGVLAGGVILLLMRRAFAEELAVLAQFRHRGR